MTTSANCQLLPDTMKEKHPKEELGRATRTLGSRWLVEDGVTHLIHLCKDAVSSRSYQVNKTQHLSSNYHGFWFLEQPSSALIQIIHWWSLKRMSFPTYSCYPLPIFLIHGFPWLPSLRNLNWRLGLQSSF